MMAPVPMPSLFTRTVTLHRFFGTADRSSAVLAAHRGVWLHTGQLTLGPATVEDIWEAGSRAARYRHAVTGGQLFWVALDVQALVRATGPRAADDAAQLSVSVARSAELPDALDHLVQVLHADPDRPRKAA